MGSQVKTRRGDEETRGGELDEEWERGRRGLRERERNTSNSQRQPAFPQQRGCHRYSPAKDAISREQKENATHRLYGSTQCQNTILHTTVSYSTGIYTSYNTDTHKHSEDACRYTSSHPHSDLPPPHFTSQLCTRTAAATSPLPTQDLKQMQTYTNLPLTCNQSCWGGSYIIKASNHFLF